MGSAILWALLVPVLSVSLPVEGQDRGGRRGGRGEPAQTDANAEREADPDAPATSEDGDVDASSREINEAIDGTSGLNPDRISRNTV